MAGSCQTKRFAHEGKKKKKTESIVKMRNRKVGSKEGK